MGLDQYAYVKEEGQQKEIATWRKHPNLQGYMEMLWEEKGQPDEIFQEFNCVELELTEDDILGLRKFILEGALPKSVGFFWGNDSDEFYKLQDLDFCKKALDHISDGKKVFYSSWW
tara:strand:- start:4723 stop:5070 length:348 start_codon:yes stop_codon:yes gene_type:complete